MLSSTIFICYLVSYLFLLFHMLVSCVFLLRPWGLLLSLATPDAIVPVLLYSDKKVQDGRMSFLLNYMDKKGRD